MLQSALDPDKGSQLLEYNLDAFKNSIWENFLGSHVQISKLVEKDGSSKVTNQIVSKLGPVQLLLEHESLYNAWEQSRISVIKDYRGVNADQTMLTESWVCRPPNVLLFNLNRVDYDRTAQKLVKNHRRFEFDKTIYLDMFLNSNKAEALQHKQRLSTMKEDLKLLKDTYRKYSESNAKGTQLDLSISSCVQLLSQFNTDASQCLKQSVDVGGQEFVFQEPSQLDISSIGISKQELEITLKTLRKVKQEAEDQVTRMAQQIEKMEQTLKQPYICTKERPFFLHAIMIHDGVAEQGHYFTYVYDRVKKQWWKLNDHDASMELEEEVFKTAFGDNGTQRSACNIVYMSKHIADQIDKYKKPLYTEGHAELFKIQKKTKQEIQEKNYNFTISQQQFIVSQCVSRINTSFRARLGKLQEEWDALQGIEDMKLHSFYHYLKSIEFGGYAKWMTLNQVF